jgi:hypothetical protein
MLPATNSQKLFSQIAPAEVNPARIPSEVPSKNPVLRPKRCISMAAGIMVAAAATIIMAIGKVARLLSGASCKPARPESVITITEAVWNSACVLASSSTLRFSA